jgi:hypothetical protein
LRLGRPAVADGHFLNDRPFYLGIAASSSTERAVEATDEAAVRDLWLALVAKLAYDERQRGQLK